MIKKKTNSTIILYLTLVCLFIFSGCGSQINSNILIRDIETIEQVQISSYPNVGEITEIYLNNDITVSTLNLLKNIQLEELSHKNFLEITNAWADNIKYQVLFNSGEHKTFTEVWVIVLKNEKLIILDLNTGKNIPDYYVSTGRQKQFVNKIDMIVEEK